MRDDPTTNTTMRAGHGTTLLAAARTASFSTVVSEESPSRLGPPLQYFSRFQVVLQRPDKLRVLNPGDGPASEFYILNYDRDHDHLRRRQRVPDAAGRLRDAERAG